VYLRKSFKPEYGLPPTQTILEKIARGNYDYVVLQVPAEFITGPEGREHDKSIDIYCEAIRAAGGTPVIYEMGWRRDEHAPAGRKRIFAAAVRNRVFHVAPCSTAWHRVRKERPGLELHTPPDRLHPGTHGYYLNLCCFYAAMTGKRPKDMPAEVRVWQHVTEAERAALKDKAKGMKFDEYDRRLPSWMRWRLAGSATVKLQSEVARYLKTVAWEEYVSMQKRLKKAIAPDHR
jgi:hypothetical protein